MRKWFLITVLALPQISRGALNCEDVDIGSLNKEIERINRRYDDFFQQLDARERREGQLRQGVDEHKAAVEARAKELERARAAYRAKPKDYAREEALRLEWEARQKEEKRQMELARLCEVQQRAKAQEILKKGRKIPELKEFDLEEWSGE